MNIFITILKAENAVPILLKYFENYEQIRNIFRNLNQEFRRLWEQNASIYLDMAIGKFTKKTLCFNFDKPYNVSQASELLQGSKFLFCNIKIYSEHSKKDLSSFLYRIHYQQEFYTEKMCICLYKDCIMTKEHIRGKTLPFYLKIIQKYTSSSLSPQTPLAFTKKSLAALTGNFPYKSRSHFLKSLKIYTSARFLPYLSSLWSLPYAHLGVVLTGYPSWGSKVLLPESGLDLVVLSSPPLTSTPPCVLPPHRLLLQSPVHSGQVHVHLPTTVELQWGKVQGQGTNWGPGLVGYCSQGKYWLVEVDIVVVWEVGEGVLRMKDVKKGKVVLEGVRRRKREGKCEVLEEDEILLVKRDGL